LFYDLINDLIFSLQLLETFHIYSIVSEGGRLKGESEGRRLQGDISSSDPRL